jgi:hypothetical protein
MQSCSSLGTLLVVAGVNRIVWIARPLAIGAAALAMAVLLSSSANAVVCSAETAACTSATANQPCTTDNATTGVCRTLTNPKSATPMCRCVHNEPIGKKSASIKMPLIQAFSNCPFPGTATTENGFPACVPEVQPSPCTLRPTAAGQIQAKVSGNVCNGGDKATKGCGADSDCPGGFCGCDIVVQFGVKGWRNNNSADCDADPCDAFTASTVVNATSIGCSGTFVCGPTSGAACTADSDCPATDICTGAPCTVTIGSGGSLPLANGFPTVSASVANEGIKRGGNACSGTGDGCEADSDCGASQVCETTCSAKGKGFVNALIPGTLLCKRLIGIVIRDNVLLDDAGNRAFEGGVVVDAKP